MPSAKPKFASAAVRKSQRDEAAKARRMEILSSNLDSAIENLNRLIETGQFFTSIQKKKVGAASIRKSPIYERRIGVLAITADEPFDYQRFSSFKEKIKADGSAIKGQIRFTYTNRNGEKVSRTVDMIAAYPKQIPKYLLGYCLLRKEERTFNLANIEDPIDASSENPIIELGSWFLESRR